MPSLRGGLFFFDIHLDIHTQKKDEKEVPIQEKIYTGFDGFFECKNSENP